MRERKRTGNPQIGEDRVRLYTKVTPEIARVEAACRTSIGRSVNVARQIERAGGRLLRKHRSGAATRGPAVRRHRVGTVGQRIEVEVSIGAGKNVERTPRRNFDDRRNRKTGEYGRHEARAADMPRVVDSGEHKATALVESGDAALGVWREIALR